MHYRLLPLLLIALIVCQSVWAMADVHQIHQSGVEHVDQDQLALNDLALIDVNMASDSGSVTRSITSVSSPADSPALFPNFDDSSQCSHCCHCHSANFTGLVPLSLSGVSRLAKQQSPIYSDQPLNRQPSSLFRPPRV